MVGDGERCCKAQETTARADTRGRVCKFEFVSIRLYVCVSVCLYVSVYLRICVHGCCITSTSILPFYSCTTSLARGGDMGGVLSKQNSPENNTARWRVGGLTERLCQCRLGNVRIRHDGSVGSSVMKGAVHCGVDMMKVEERSRVRFA